MSEHPTLVLALRTRTRTVGTLNIAVALRGRSTGWGRKSDGALGRPRRTFIGHHRTNSKGGRHFVSLVLYRGHSGDEIWSRTISLDQSAGATP